MPRNHLDETRMRMLLKKEPGGPEVLSKAPSKELLQSKNHTYYYLYENPGDTKGWRSDGYKTIWDCKSHWSYPMRQRLRRKIDKLKLSNNSELHRWATKLGTDSEDGDADAPELFPERTFVEYFIKEPKMTSTDGSGHASSTGPMTLPPPPTGDGFTTTTTTTTTPMTGEITVTPARNQNVARRPRKNKRLTPYPLDDDGLTSSSANGAPHGGMMGASVGGAEMDSAAALASGLTDSQRPGVAVLPGVPSMSIHGHLSDPANHQLATLESWLPNLEALSAEAQAAVWSACTSNPVFQCPPGRSFAESFASWRLNPVVNVISISIMFQSAFLVASGWRPHTEETETEAQPQSQAQPQPPTQTQSQAPVMQPLQPQEPLAPSQFVG